METAPAEALEGLGWTALLSDAINVVLNLAWFDLMGIAVAYALNGPRA